MPASVVLVMSCTATTNNSCNTFQADSLYRAINHPSQYECSHWIYYKCILKIFDYGSAASTFWLRLVTMNGHILEISQRISVTQV